MKRIVLAAIAALLVYAAQAVTVSWEKQASGANGTFAIPSAFGLGSTYAAVVSGGQLPAVNSYQTLLMVQSQNNTHQIRLKVAHDGTFAYETKNGGTWSTVGFENSPTLSPEGKQVVAFTLGAEGAVTFYAGETVLGTLTLFEGTTPTWTTVFYGKEPASGNRFSGTIDVFLTNDTVSGKDIAALPEPTALALLALGVAGLALRRRAA